MQIREHVPLAPLTTIQLGGEARYLAECSTERDVGEALRFARDRRLSVQVMGGGSNLIFPDAGFPGLVLRVGGATVTWEERGDGAEVVASAGAAWDPVPSVTLAADVQRVGWGELDELAFTPLGPAPPDTVPMGWEDAWAWRLGVEARREGGLAFRAGYAREESPASEEGVNPLFPDAEREALSAGAGFDWGGSRFDLAYRLTVLDDREGIARPDEGLEPDGVYESTEHDFSIAVTRRF